MRYAVLLLLGLALLPHAVRGDQAPISACVDALEQLETLQTVAPVHLVRSPECMQDRDRLSMMEKKDARTPADDLARTRKRVLAQCPDVDLAGVWLVEWVPPPVTPNG
jgi:hypothetical protein